MDGNCQGMTDSHFNGKWLLGIINCYQIIRISNTMPLLKHWSIILHFYHSLNSIFKYNYCKKNKS